MNAAHSSGGQTFNKVSNTELVALDAESAEVLEENRKLLRTIEKADGSNGKHENDDSFSHRETLVVT